MMQRCKVSAVVVVLAMAGVVLSAASAGATSPPSVTCGQTITTSVVLKADLACSGDALIIGASGVTVRLAGHTITSTDGTGVGVRFGVPATDTTPAMCVENAVVRGGTISGFFAAITQSGCSSSSTIANQVSGPNLESNTWGVYLQAQAHVVVDHSTIVGPNGIGGPFAPGAATGVVEVSHSRIQVTTSDGFGVLAALARSTIDSTRIDGGRIDVIADRIAITNSRLTGVAVQCGDAEVTISNTRVTGGGIQGSACGYHLSNDRFIGPGSGEAVSFGSSSFPSEVTGSTFSGWDTAVRLGSGPATLTGNTFRGNGTGVVSWTCDFASCSGTVSGNSFVDNSGTGLLLTRGTWHVGSNTALRNGGLGIDAEGADLTVIDDGGNVARRNLPPQCVGVVCAPHA